MHGSLVNRMQERNLREPEVGMGCTFLHYSDRSPGTVVEIVPFKSGKYKGKARLVMVRPDNVKVISGSTENGSARYEITPAEEGPTVTVRRMPDRRHKDQETGEVVLIPQGFRSGSSGVSFGHRESYYDPTR